MTAEYREELIKSIKAVCILRMAIIDFDADSLYLSYVHVGQMMCEELIKVCEKHRALFAIETTPSPLIKFAIFQRQSNA